MSRRLALKACSAIGGQYCWNILSGKIALEAFAGQPCSGIPASTKHYFSIVAQLVEVNVVGTYCQGQLLWRPLQVNPVQGSLLQQNII